MDVPKIVTDNTGQRWSRRRFMGGAVGVAALGSFATACGGARPSASALRGAPAWPSGSSASPRAPRAPPASTPSCSAALPGPEAVRAGAGAAGVKPITLSPGDPTVFSRVPLTDKVVFVTIDDGIEKDPTFIQMVKDFRCPSPSASLTC